MYSPNFSAKNKTFCLSLHCNGDDSYLFVNGKEVTKFKAKNSEIKANQLALGSISASANVSSCDIEDVNCMEMFMILVLIIVPLQMMKY